MKTEVSIGELVDKVTILEIKTEKFKNAEKLANVRKEYEFLKNDMNSLGITNDSDEFKKLKKVNLKLWHIEDDIRIEEANQNFGEKFIQLARNVYFENDTRAAIKKEINLKFGSELMEEKEYIDYKNKK
jgi:protein subunit release factor A